MVMNAQQAYCPRIENYALDELLLNSKSLDTAFSSQTHQCTRSNLFAYKPVLPLSFRCCPTLETHSPFRVFYLIYRSSGRKYD